MKALLFLTLVFIFCTFNLLAGDEIGNGGDVIVCINNDDTETVQMLDEYEGKTLRDFEYIKNDGEDTILFIRKILNRLKKIDYHRAVQYEKWLDTFESESRLLNNIYIPDIADHREAIIPLNCKLEQIAFQKANPLMFENRYVIKKDLYEKMDRPEFLIIHEIIYREAIESGHVTSAAVRYFNSLIFSKKLTEITSMEYIQIIRDLPFNHVSFKGFNFLLYSDKETNGVIRKLPTPFTIFDKTPENLVAASGAIGIMGNGECSKKINLGGFEVNILSWVGSTSDHFLLAIGTLYLIYDFNINNPSEISIWSNDESAEFQYRERIENKHYIYSSHKHIIYKINIGLSFEQKPMLTIIGKTYIQEFFASKILITSKGHPPLVSKDCMVLVNSTGPRRKCNLKQSEEFPELFKLNEDIIDPI